MSSDERLDAGRHHLENGSRAMRQGFLDESRSHFEAALLQFRGPELRLGEAHALRGMAEVELHCGNLQSADAVIRSAIREYQEVRNQLDRVDPHRVSGEMRRDAEEAEAASFTLQGEILMRTGRAEEARQSLDEARSMYQGLGADVPSSAGVFLTLARLGLREGHSSEARAAAQQAIDVLGRCGDVAGQAGAWLLAAEIDRIAGRLQEAEAALEQAKVHSQQTRQASLVGRVASQRASLFAQLGRHAEASAAYDEALAKIREAGDVDMEAYAMLGRGDVRSRLGEPGAVFDLIEAARLLAHLDHRHGLGSAMLRLSEHALRLSMPAYALAAAESARQFWQVSDPGRGVGQAMRLQVKALAALRKWPAVITTAHARAALVGDDQPNAIQVREFYRERAPTGLLSEIDLLSDREVELRSESMIEALLEPTMRQLDLDFQSLGVPGGALVIVSALAKATPAPAPMRSTPGPASRGADPSHEALEQAPPDEQEPALPGGPGAAQEYADLYVSPVVQPDPPFRADDDAEATPALPAEDATTEDGRAEGVIASLQQAALPSGYEGLYDRVKPES